ncbi:MAG: DNA polymerase III subunit beta [Puniceicoccales bacterium]|jgi:DNA polymerase-3 subunit beta|nr:DNA polymerase III subunit beta [Puniceicoccales bacterium]
MKFSIEKTAFVNGLQQVLSIVEQRAIIPVLSNVLLDCADGGLKITATNLDISIHCQVKAEAEREGKITLPAKKLAAIVRSLPGDTVVAELVGTTVKISSGRSNFQIMGLSADDFPTTGEPNLSNKTQLQQAEMAKMLKNVSFAQSNDDNRFILNSVYFCFDQNKLTFAATDGRRLSLVSKEIAENTENPKGVIIPSKTIREIERLLGQGEEVAFLFDSRQIVFLIAVDKENKDGLMGDIKVVSKIVEGNYPNFRQIIPQGAESRVKLDRQLTLECIQRVAIVANDQKNLVKLHFENNTLEISAESQEYGNAHEKIAIVYEGKPIEIAFNYMFICDPLKVLTQDEVFFEFKDELSAGVFKTLEDFLYVVMPLRMG